MILPEKAFDCAYYQEVKADKYGLISIDKKHYSTSPRFAGQRVRVSITYNNIVISNEDNEVIVTHTRLYGVKRKSMIWQPYLELLSRRPRAIKYSSIYEEFPVIWSDYLMSCTVEEQKAALSLLGKLLKNDDFTLLNKALEVASEYGHPSADQIKHCFYSILNQENSHNSIIPKVSVSQVPKATRGLTHYDAFFKVGGANLD
ncbi:hypothetical protein GCM10011391_35460 [Pullulanibacillus camelliae]|uniref:Transposase for insertion sequence element IS21-like C-terminal domain-containing protein n=1 Tax=Pullulanibacillus camelliae TaxID=1707096 RepID=A0A8J2YMN5_9BACL|nr:hypothetical protein GCM10011391_35460 [Pullulanibacillus camelliae]